MRTFKTFLIAILITFLLWLAGCSIGLPVIPFVATDYFIEGSDNSLKDGYVVTSSDNETTKIEIPDYFTDDNQCLDFWFTTSYGNHFLTVKNFKITVFDINDNVIMPTNSYLFRDDGSENEKFSIDNYEIGTDKYVFFRTVVDLSGESRFAINIKADYLIDSVRRNIDKTYVLEKRKQLTWNELRAH